MAHITVLGQPVTVTQSNGYTPQTIAFGMLSNQTFGVAPITLGATATSGLLVSFNSQTTSVCTVSGSQVTLVAGGTCTIQATQAGNATYSAATPVSQSFQVTQASQAIGFGALGNVTLGAAPFTANATASSGLPVSFASQTASVCTVSGSQVTPAALGLCTIQATQAGNGAYAAATPVSQSFHVVQGLQTIVVGSAAGASSFVLSYRRRMGRHRQRFFPARLRRKRRRKRQRRSGVHL